MPDRYSFCFRSFGSERRSLYSPDRWSSLLPGQKYDSCGCPGLPFSVEEVRWGHHRTERCSEWHSPSYLDLSIHRIHKILISTFPGKSDIDRGGVDGLMSHEGLNIPKIIPGFIHVSTHAMTEGVGSDPFVLPSKAVTGILNDGKDGVGRKMSIRFLPREQPFFGFAPGTPILGKNIKRFFRQRNISGGMILGMLDVNHHPLPGNVLVLKRYHFRDPQSTGIQKCDDGFVFQVGKSVDELKDLFLGKDLRWASVDSLVWQPIPIDWAVKNIQKEEPNKGNVTVHRFRGILHIPDQMKYILLYLFVRDFTGVDTHRITPGEKSPAHTQVVCMGSFGQASQTYHCVDFFQIIDVFGHSYSLLIKIPQQNFNWEACFKHPKMIPS